MVNPDPPGSEPFLQAIFADPANDTPRLIFADWLEERGGAEWAELIRLDCSDAPYAGRRSELMRAVWGERAATARGFPVDFGLLVTTAEELADPAAFRAEALARSPESYGARRLGVIAGPIVTPEPLRTILTSPVTQNVTELKLSGREELDSNHIAESAQEGEPVFVDFIRRPVINSAMVEALAGMRECRRLTVLDLRNNDLGNDAVRALAQSPYFDRLQTLRLSEGNRFRGRVWQQVLERFGEEVVE